MKPFIQFVQESKESDVKHFLSDMKSDIMALENKVVKIKRHVDDAAMKRNLDQLEDLLNKARKFIHDKLI